LMSGPFVLARNRTVCGMCRGRRFRRSSSSITWASTTCVGRPMHADHPSKRPCVAAPGGGMIKRSRLGLRTYASGVRAFDATDHTTL
jgi:hypothetical protein